MLKRQVKMKSQTCSRFRTAIEINDFTRIVLQIISESCNPKPIKDSIFYNVVGKILLHHLNPIYALNPRLIRA